MSHIITVVLQYHVCSSIGWFWFVFEIYICGHVSAHIDDAFEISCLLSNQKIDENQSCEQCSSVRVVKNDLPFLQWEWQKMVGRGTEQRWMAETKLWICPTIFLHSSYSRWNLRAVDEWAPSYWTWPALERRRFAVVDTSVMKKFISKLNIVLMPCFKVWPLIANLSHWVSALSLWWPFFSSRGSEYLAWWTELWTVLFIWSGKRWFQFLQWEWTKWWIVAQNKTNVGN